MYHMYAVKAISITDDIYAKLNALKGDKSFSEILEQLLNNGKVNPIILNNYIGILGEEEANRIGMRPIIIEGEHCKEIERIKNFINFKYIIASAYV